MARIITFIAVVALVACGSSGPPEPFHGEWKVTSVVTAATSAAPSAEASGRIGLVVSLEPGRARAGDHTCSGATYSRRSLSPETFSEAYRVTPQQLALSSDPIPLVDVTCASGDLQLGSTLVLKSDTSMLTMWDGVFYVLTRS